MNAIAAENSSKLANQENGVFESFDDLRQYMDLSKKVSPQY